MANLETGTRCARAQHRFRLPAVASAAALALSMAGVSGVATVAAARPTPTATTVAAIDPALTAGRGAHVNFVEQEAENAVTTGTVIGFDTSAYTLAAEASGRKAVKLTTAGQYVEFTLARDTNAVTIRYSIPDAATGGGIQAPITLSADGWYRRTVTLTSKYTWLYNEYPFANDPTAGALHPDWWTAECGCVPNQTTPTPVFPTPFRPMHFYDEQRVLLGATFRAGDKIRLTVPKGTNAAWYAIDLIDSEMVAAPAAQPRNSVNVLAFGADPFGHHDSADAFDAAITWAKAHDKSVFIPAGTFQVNRHIIVDNVTIQGAGNWWSIIRGTEVTLPAMAPDGSLHTSVGFYGKYSADGGSSNVHLSNFAIYGDITDRVDNDQVNGIGGALNNSTVDGLYITHTKVGLWMDGPIDNFKVTNTMVVDVIADGVNFDRAVTNSSVKNSFFRTTGDDAMAMWSFNANGPANAATDADTNDVFDHNTVQTPTLANGIAVYGGTNNTISNNVVADPIREGSALHAGQRFNSTPFAGYLKFTNNTTVRAGSLELNWNIGLGAIWLYALEGSLTADVEVNGDNFLQSTYNAILIVSDFGVKDLYNISNVHFANVKVDGTGTSVLSARAAGGASFQNVVARNVGAVPVNNCGSFHFTAAGSEFSLTDLGGNDTWLAPWLLPNTITCDDRPPVVAPPAPSAW
jgi:Pectate lyase superfamily protein